MAKETIPNNGLWSAIAALLNGNFTELYRQSGWADYTDTQYTSGSPFAIAATTKTKLPNNAGTVRDQELPADYTDGFYDNVGQVINGLAGDGLLITVEFKAVRQTGNGSFDIEVMFDIGGAVGEIYNRTIGVKGGAGVADSIVFTTAVYTLDTWEANGAGVYVDSDVAINVYGVRYVVHRLHKGFGTYPPA